MTWKDDLKIIVIKVIVVTLNDDNHDDCDVSMMATTLKIKGFNYCWSKQQTLSK